MSGPPQARGSLRSARRVALAALVAAAAIGAHAPCLRAGFVLDDERVIVRNRLVHAGDLGAILRGGWRGPLGPDKRGPVDEGLYRPLTIWTFALDHRWHGLAPAPFHATNLLLHALVSILVLALALHLLPVAAATAAALLHAVHPLRAEAVCAVVGRADLLAAGFVLLALLALLRHRRSRAAASYLAALACAGLALLAKESGVVVLPLAALMELHTADRSRPRRARLAGAALRLAGLAVPLVLGLALRRAVLGHLLPAGTISTLDNPLVALPAWERMLGAAAVLGKGLALVAWPARLSCDYSHQALPLAATPPNAWTLAHLVVLGGGLALAWRGRRLPGVGLGVGFFLVAVSIVSNMAFPIGTIFAERLLYLPAVGLALAVAGAGYAAVRAAAADRGERVWVGAALIVLVLLAALATRTWRRSAEWRDPPTLYASAVHAYPTSAKAQTLHAEVLLAAGRDAAALAALRRAVTIHPAYPSAWTMIGIVERRRNRLAAAREAYEEALRWREDAITHYDLALLHHLHLHDPAAAIVHYRATLALDPTHASAHLNLALLLAERGDLRPAITHLRAVLTHAPGRHDAARIRDTLAAWEERARRGGTH